LEQEQEDEINWEILYDYMCLQNLNNLRQLMTYDNESDKKQSFQIYQYKRITHYEYSSW